jgi:hypothetical protein
MAQIAKDEVERLCAAGTEQMQGGHLWRSLGGGRGGEVYGEVRSQFWILRASQLESQVQE